MKSTKQKSAKAPKPDPLAVKAAAIRAQFTAKDLADIQKDFAVRPADLEGVVRSLGSFTKVEELLKMLEQADRRNASDLKAYEDIRAKGLDVIDDWRLVQTKSAASALRDEFQIRVKHFAESRNEVASLRARLLEIQGGLLPPTMKALPAPASSVVEGKKVVESPKDISWLTFRRSVLEACLMVAPKKELRANLVGVYLSSHQKEIRAVATNGHTLLLHSTPAEKDQVLNNWLTAGVILPRDELALALGVLSKTKSGPDDEVSDLVQIGYAPGHGYAIVKDREDFATFRMRVVDGKFPEYQKVIEAAGSVLTGGERAALSGNSLAAEYVKQAAVIGAKFECKGLTPFVGEGEKTPVVITFLGEPGALFIVMPIGAKAEEQMPVQTMALIGRGLEGTLAALKATQTRQRRAMAETKGDDVKKSMQAVIDERDLRIAAVLQAINGKKLEAPAAARRDLN
jgi:hypothetical protein